MSVSKTEPSQSLYEVALQSDVLNKVTIGQFSCLSKPQTFELYLYAGVAALCETWREQVDLFWNSEKFACEKRVCTGSSCDGERERERETGKMSHFHWLLPPTYLEAIDLPAPAV